MKILAISGSLRAASINTAALEAIARLAPPGVGVEVYRGLDALPLFNPDREPDPPACVLDFWARVERADALIIASPEYAHGISGAMKNALDWLVGLEGFVGKRVAVVNTSERAHHADEALRETLRTMATGLLGEASTVLPLRGAWKGSPTIEDFLDTRSRVERLFRQLGLAAQVTASTSASRDACSPKA